MIEVNCIAKVNTRTHFQALGERGVSNHFLLQDTQILTNFGNLIDIV